jgi:hypothetical protein
MPLLEVLDRPEQRQTRELARAHELDDAPCSHVRLRFEAGQGLRHLQLWQQVPDLCEPLLDDGMLVDEPAKLLFTQPDGLAGSVRYHVRHADAALVADAPLAERVGLAERRDHV